MELVQEKQKTAFTTLKKEFGWTNPMQTPRIEKIIISVGVGKMLKEKGKLELVADRLGKITGQKPLPRGAKKSIATFKTRIGDTIGYQVTLRGARARDFFNRLVHIALPRTKDFKGVSPDSIDEMGNYTLGIREHSVFPETSDEELKDVFGMSMTIVTTAKTKQEARAYLEYLGLPFKK
ncbi:MAG: 50S ribosomal protein L5 [Patescibacteria group bacterium]|nr:50S ribosomal protein L5 [Patescibacteria group bacterium]